MNYRDLISVIRNNACSAFDEPGYNPESLDSDGMNAIHYAAIEGDIEAVKILVEHGFSVDTLSSSKFTLLDIAVDKSNYDLMSYGLAGRTLADPRPDMMNALDVPAMDDDWKAASILLQHEAKIDGSPENRPPIAWAAQEGSRNFFTNALASGADPFRSSVDERDPESALHLAATSGDLDMLNEIFQRVSRSAVKENLYEIRRSCDDARAYRQEECSILLAKILDQ